MKADTTQMNGIGSSRGEAAELAQGTSSGGDPLEMNGQRAYGLNGFHPVISHEEIAKRAYEIYLESGCLPGRCQQNWQKAEKDLTGGAHKVHIPSTQGGGSAGEPSGRVGSGPLQLTPAAEALPPLTIGSEFTGPGARGTSSLSHRFTKR